MLGEPVPRWSGLFKWTMDKEDRLPLNHTVKISMQSMREKYAVQQ
ncbi:hypothetical protein [Paenibacillus cremeus]|nr:hypothetical protein [Paenibacillus cremeus]